MHRAAGARRRSLPAGQAQEPLTHLVNPCGAKAVGGDDLARSTFAANGVDVEGGLPCSCQDWVVGPVRLVSSVHGVNASCRLPTAMRVRLRTDGERNAATGAANAVAGSGARGAPRGRRSLPSRLQRPRLRLGPPLGCLQGALAAAQLQRSRVPPTHPPPTHPASSRRQTPLYAADCYQHNSKTCAGARSTPAPLPREHGPSRPRRRRRRRLGPSKLSQKV